MKIRVPLSIKIVAWFFLNLLLLGLGFAVLFHANVGFDSILSTVAKPNVQAVAGLVSQELNAQPTTAWDTVLKRFEQAYHMNFALFFNEGKQIAGAAMQLPKEVLARMPPSGPHPDRIGEGSAEPLPDLLLGGDPLMQRPPPPLGRRGEGHPGGPPEDGPEGREGRPPPLPPGQRPQFDPRPQRFGDSNTPLFILSTSHPTAYWAGVGVPVFDPLNGAALPVSLIMRGQALAGGFFFDSKPWLVAGFGAVLLSVLFWFPLIRGLTLSIRKVTGATARLAEGDFSVRVPDQRGDELGTLGGSVNLMAEKLAGYVSGQKRFLGDIAHELCSPIARMQAAVGIMEQRNTDPAQMPNVERMGRELRHMSDLVNELLSFSKASLHRDLDLQPVRLAPLVRRVIERESPGGDAIQNTVSDELSVIAEPELLARAIGNVVRNALRYAADGGPILVHASNGGDEVHISIRDQGPGVSDSALPKLFDAFYRPDASRARETGGVGLGLAIVKSCVEACQGTVTANHVRPHGLEVRMRLVNGS